MTKTNRSWLYLGLAAGFLVASTVLVGMTNHVSTPSKRIEIAKDFSSKEMAAKDALKEELERRFTDNQNVNFGISRLIPVGSRYHLGPTMEKMGRRVGSQIRTADKDRFESLVEGEWIPTNEIKPAMTPENDAERQAINFLKSQKVDVAIYTLGQFHLDKNEKPGPVITRAKSDNPHFINYSWGSGTGLRAKGPAYISQKSSTAPRSYEIVDFGREAWRSGEEDYLAQGKDGWMYFAHRVAAPDMSCAKCHGEKGTYNKGSGKVEGTVNKPGDSVGLFVIAMRRSK